MGKRKNSEYKFKSYEPLFPNIRWLTYERCRCAIRNLFNAKTHHAKYPIRNDAEASAILDCMESVAIERHKIIELSADEVKNAQKLGLIPDGVRAFLVKRPKKPKNNGQENSST
jgi:hypothetical protein